MMIGLFKELVVNACIMVTVVFIGSQFFINQGLNEEFPNKLGLEAGIVSGILGIILIIFSIKIPPNGMIDLRHIAIMLSAVYGSWISILISGTILALFRLLYVGISYTAIVGSATIIIAMIINIFINLLCENKNKRWVFVFMTAEVVTLVGFYLAIGEKDNLIYISVSYTLGLIFATTVGYFLTNHLIQSYNLLNHLKEESTIDYLTGLYNTRSFDKLFNLMVRDSLEEDTKISILMLDIDFFKRVNDTYGHNVGDIVLKELGKLLSQVVRNIDIVARVGGEEFCIILRDCSKDKTLEIAERIRKTVEENSFVVAGGNILKISISIGCAIYPDTTSDIKKLKETADKKLYQAKHTGRNKVVI